MQTANTSTSLNDLYAYPLLRNIFLELNTALPTNEVRERLFSAAGCAFVSNRTRMRDDHFEEQLLLRINVKCNTSDGCCLID